mmetsp:Transcript_22202/g.48543  ORF Transcript_22202/g.48543 Transcript_22202/m.48543 type:complete len:189 (+) Transcript_22202:93-659(+)
MARGRRGAKAGSKMNRSAEELQHAKVAAEAEEWYKSNWLVAEERSLDEECPGIVPGPERLMGLWVDSRGKTVHVSSTDAYDVKLIATLSKFGQPDIHLALRPVWIGAGWQCGHYLLDPMWTTETQLHWVALDGRVSVWVRPKEYPLTETGIATETVIPEQDKGDEEAKGDIHGPRSSRSTTADSTMSG